MSGETVHIAVDVQRALDTLSGHVFAGPKTCVRELIANAADSIAALPPEDLGNVEIRLERRLAESSLSLTDSGVGMTRAEAKARLGTIFHSSKLPRSGAIGQFGIGFYSCFPLCRRLEVRTRTRQPDDPGTRIVYDGGAALRYEEHALERPGTTIILHLRSEYRELLDGDVLAELVARDCDFVPYPIYLGTGFTVLNRLDAPWYHMGASPDRIADALRDIFGWGELLAVLPLQRDEAPGIVRGALAVPARGGDATLRLYSHRVLIREDASSLLPETLRPWVAGVVDAEDVPLVLSRDAVLEDAESTRLLRSVLRERFGDGLADLARRARRDFRTLLAHHGRAVKEACLAEPRWMDRLRDRLEFSTSLRPSVTVDEVLAAHPDGARKIIYADDHSACAALVPLYNRANREVVYMTDPEDARLRAAWSRHDPDLVFERLDVDPPAEDESDSGVDAPAREALSIEHDRLEALRQLVHGAVDARLEVEVRGLGAEAPAALLAVSDHDRRMLGFADEVRRLARRGQLDRLPDELRSAAEAGLVDRLIEDARQTLILNLSDSVVVELLALLGHSDHEFTRRHQSDRLLGQLARFLHAQALLGSGRPLDGDTLRDIAGHQRALLTHLLRRIRPDDRPTEEDLS
ncbi:MAG: ATP-binding protein [Acidobacteriota bacterium]